MNNLDLILDEELERLELSSDENNYENNNNNENNKIEHYFPEFKDCECCKGYSLNCKCTEDGSPECLNCTTKLPTQHENIEEYDFPTDPLLYNRTIQASATAVLNSTAPILTRLPSTTTTTNTTTPSELFNYSVKMYPPPSTVLSRDMFKMMFLPGVRSALSEGQDTENVSWTDRGWRTQQEFETEVEAALQSRTYNLDGIIIARKQSEEEAKNLVAKLTDIQVFIIIDLIIHFYYLLYIIYLKNYIFNFYILDS